jgi:hypothetical protein
MNEAELHAWLGTPCPPTGQPAPSAAPPRDRVGEFIEHRNREAADRPSPLFPGRKPLELVPPSGDLVADYIARRNAAAAARPNPVRQR